MYFVFDTETNGLPIKEKDGNLNFSNVYLYQIAYYKYDKDLKEYSRLNLYVDLIDYSNFKYIEKNKITEEILKTKGKKINKILDFINKILSDVILLVAHNLSFDINVLLVECLRNKKMELYDKLLDIPKFDTMRYAGSLGLNIINRLLPSQEDTYNFIFFKKKPNKKNNGYQPLTIEQMEKISQGKAKLVECYTSTHDALDDTKHCGEIFCYLFKDWDNCIIRFGKCKGLKIPFYKQSKNYQLWILKKYKEENESFKISHMESYREYKQSSFTDYMNYVKFKNYKK